MPYPEAKYPPKTAAGVIQKNYPTARETFVPLLNGCYLAISETGRGLSIGSTERAKDGHPFWEYSLCRISKDGVLAFAYSGDGPEKVGQPAERWTR